MAIDKARIFHVKGFLKRSSSYVDVCNPPVFIYLLLHDILLMRLVNTVKEGAFDSGQTSAILGLDTVMIRNLPPDWFFLKSGAAKVYNIYKYFKQSYGTETVCAGNQPDLRGERNTEREGDGDC
jgi:hypothetical protein